MVQLFYADRLGLVQAHLDDSMVADINQNGSLSVNSKFVLFDGDLYFTGYDESHGYELWRYDGSSASRVTDIYPGEQAPDIGAMTVFDDGNGDALYFAAYDGVSGHLLWKWDGTTASLVNIPNVSYVAYGAAIAHFDDGNGDALYFSGSYGYEYELIRWDGTTATKIDVNLSGSSAPNQLTVLNDGTHDILFFSAQDASHGTELWMYDGSGVSLVTDDVNPGANSSSPSDFVLYDHDGLNGPDVYFVATDAGGDREIWKWDGATATKTDVYVGLDSYEPDYLTVFGGKLYFSAYDSTTQSLWSYDGATATKVNIPSVYQVLDLEVFNDGSGNALYMSAAYGSDGFELVKWDGASSTLVANIAPSYQSSYPYGLKVLDDGTGEALYFSAYDRTNGRELWKWDGDYATRLTDIAPGSGSGLNSSHRMAVFDDAIYFNGSDGVHGVELWKFSNQAPAANDDPAVVNDWFTDEDTALGAVPGRNVLSNDSDPDGDVITVLPGKSDTVSAQGALVVFNADGTFLYDPTGMFDGLDATDSATDSFSYVMQDEHAVTQSATVTIVINGVNDAPVAKDDEGVGFSTDEDSSFVTGNVFNDNGHGADSDADDPLVVDSFDSVSASGALISYNGSGAFTYNPNGQFEGLDTGDSVTDTFTYTLKDDDGATSSATVTIVINGVNDEPTTSDNTVSTLEDVPYVFTAADFNFSDVDAGDTLQGIRITFPASRLLALTDNGLPVDPGHFVTIANINAGLFQYQPGADESGSPYDSFKLQVSDGTAFSGGDGVTMTINVGAVNDKPVALAKNPDTKEDVVSKVTLSGDDGDPDADQALAYFINSLPDNGKLYATKADAQAGINSLAAGAQLAGNIVWFKSDQDNHKDRSFTYVVKDDGGAAGGGIDTSDPALVSMDIYSVNDAPVVHMPNIKAVHDETRRDAMFNVVRDTQIFVTDVDSDGDRMIEAKVTATNGILKLREWTNVTLTGNGTPALKLVGAVKWINEALKGMRYDPYDWFSGNAKVTVYANDRGNNGQGGALTDTEDMTIKVKNGYIWNWREWWNLFMG